jgi:hypothetical protein
MISEPIIVVDSPRSVGPGTPGSQEPGTHARKDALAFPTRRDPSVRGLAVWLAGHQDAHHQPLQGLFS